MIIRKNAALIILNSENKVLVGKRRDIENAWQLPQGGVDDGESFTEAMWRELFEETGFTDDDCEIITNSLPITYILPDEIRFKRGFDGQEQIYFLLRYISEKEPLINDEFEAFAWLEPADVIDKSASFKKNSYILAFNQLLGENFI